MTKIEKLIWNDPNDDRPLGGAKKFSIPEFADSEYPPADFKPKPKVIPKRVAAKKESTPLADTPSDKIKPASSNTDKPWLKKGDTNE